ncbi:MAG: TetR/AcrR family transcriptional regulator [Armatimonadetes bacterium]|nr:TetR/AcrR family transcriptional regulator [Armatimonadota bacterium]
MKRRQRRAELTREKIFQAAITLFAQRGLENVTVEQITELAEMGKGTFFNYFSSKEAVLAYFGGLQVARIQEAIQVGEVAGSAPEQIEKILTMLATYPPVTPELARNLFLAALSTQRFAQIGGQNIWDVEALLVGIARHGQEEGSLTTHRTAADIALFVLGQYFLGLLTWCSGFSDSDLLETVQRFVRMALDAVRRGADASG